MGGVAKAVTGTVGSVAKVISNPGKAKLGDFATAAGVGSIVGPLNTIGARLALGPGGGGGGGATSAGYADTPASTLAMTGGAPLLANIAMGASVEDTLAGYFGAGDYKSFYAGLSPDDQQLVDGVKKQLTEIQSNTDLRNQAVQQVVNDFPNIAKQAAQAQSDAKTSAGEEFDSTTKGYIDQALNGTAAKYAANGGLSSGAMAEATARVGAQYGMDKLNYTNSRGDLAYKNATDSGLGNWQAKYNETNALRNFQNLMTGNAAGQGFSAVQSMLNRKQQTNLTNAGFANQQNMQDQANNNAMFGAIGQLGGTAIGAAFGGPAGAAVGSSVGKMATSSMGGASDYGFSGPATPGYAENTAAINPNNNWR